MTSLDSCSATNIGISHMEVISNAAELHYFVVVSENAQWEKNADSEWNSQRSRVEDLVHAPNVNQVVAGVTEAMGEDHDSEWNWDRSLANASDTDHVIAAVEEGADSHSEWDAPDITHHVESVNSVTAVDPDSEWNSESSRWEDNFYSQDVENINEGAIEAGGEDPDSEWNSDSSRVEVVRSALVIGQAMASLDEGVGADSDSESNSDDCHVGEFSNVRDRESVADWSDKDPDSVRNSELFGESLTHVDEGVVEHVVRRSQLKWNSACSSIEEGSSALEINMLVLHLKRCARIRTLSAGVPICREHMDQVGCHS